MTKKYINQGWKQIADALKCSERQAQRKYERVRVHLEPMLKHYAGPGTWMKMDHEEILEFKNLLFQDAINRRHSRGPRPRIMSDFVAVCQGKLFD